MPTTDCQEDTLRAFRGGSTMLAASAFGNGVGYLIGIVLARMLGADDFGLYALGLTVFNVLALGSLCGADTTVIKFASEAIQRGDRLQAAKTLLIALGFVLLAGAIAAAFLLWSSHTWLLALYGHPRLSTVLALFSLMIPVSLAVTVFMASFQAAQAFKQVVIVRYLWEPSGKLLLSVLAVSAGWGLTGAVGAFGVVSLVSLILASRYAAAALARGFRGSTFDRESIAPLMRYSLPLTVMMVAGVIAPRTDVLFLGYWADPAQVGLYQAAFQTAAILALIAGALDMAFAPLAAGLFANRDLGRLKSLYQNVSRWSLTLSLPVALLFTVLGADILALFGPSFPQAAACLLLLAFGQWMNNWTTFAHSALLMSGHARLLMVNSIGVGGLLIALNWVLIPRWGITGAAIAVSLCMTLGGLLRVGQVWMLHGLHPFSVELAKPFCAGIVALLAGHWLRGLLGAEFVLGLMLGIGAIYLALLYFMKLEEPDRLALAALVQRARGHFAV